jgi:hypothetical protein
MFPAKKLVMLYGIKSKRYILSVSGVEGRYDRAFPSVVGRATSGAITGNKMIVFARDSAQRRLASSALDFE